MRPRTAWPEGQPLLEQRAWARVASAPQRHVRLLVKSGMARGLRWTRADAGLAALRGLARRPLILGYHRVIGDHGQPSGLPGMVIRRSTLERHLDWIGRRYRLASLDEIGERMEAGASAEGLAAVTFDDGYNDVYENAFPMLARKGIPAAVFVVTDVVGSPDPPLFERLYLALARAFKRWSDPVSELSGRLCLLDLAVPDPLGKVTPLAMTQGLLDKLPAVALRVVVDSLEEELGRDEAALLRPMSWDALREMSRAGVVIGSHTRSHALLTLEWTPSALGELRGSRHALEANLGRPVRHFAYPDGRWNVMATAFVAEAGYQFAYTICGHRHGGSPLLTIPRRMLWEGSCLDAAGRFSEALMSCHASGVFDLITPCRRRHYSPAVD